MSYMSRLDHMINDAIANPSPPVSSNLIPYAFFGPATGLKPTWSSFRTWDGAERISVAPPINELGDGLYGYSWNPIKGGDVLGTISFGPDYPDVVEAGSTRETSIVLGLAVLLPNLGVPTTP